MLANDWTPGQHSFSRDGVNWTVAEDKPYTFAVPFTDGTNTTMRVRERPQLLLTRSGQPRYLSTSVQPGDHTVDDSTYTLVQAVVDTGSEPGSEPGKPGVSRGSSPVRSLSI